MAFHDGDLDSDTANRLLAGRLEPDDAPPCYRKVAQLLQDARSGNGHPEVTDDAVILAVVDAITHPDELAQKRKHMLTRIVTTKVATVTAVVALSATGAAAATGSLPDTAQNGLAKAAAHIGINLPDTANDKARDATQPDADDAGDTPDASGSATTDEPSATTDEQGTVADANSSQDDTATGDAPQAVPPAAASSNTQNHGSVVSQTAHEADPSDGKGEEVSPVARDNHGAEVRSEKDLPPTAGSGQSGDDHGGTPADEANQHAGDNAGQPHGKP